jgi:hypothetical protein
MSRDNLLLPPGFKPEKKLKLKEDEHFARLIAAGVNNRKAITTAFPQKVWTSAASERVAGFQKSRKPEIQARIQYLRSEQEDLLFSIPTAPVTAPEMDYSRAGLIELMREITSALSQAIRTLVANGAPPRDTAKLRSDLLLHIKRLDKMQPPEIEAVAPDSDGFDLLLRWANGVQVCTCSEAAGART